MKEITELVIDRSKWMRGALVNETCLLDEDGKMCCLGFYALACGAGKDEIRNVFEPDGLAFHVPGLTERGEGEAGILRNTAFTRSAVPINDTRSMGEDQREEALIDLFKENDVSLSFEG